MKVIVVGSGPIGATYARLILEGIDDATVLMAELGPQLTPIAGMNVRNIADEDEKVAARLASQGPQSVGAGGLGIGVPGGAMVEGTFTARQGTHLIDYGGVGSGHTHGFPAAAVATCVGGQGAHWTCATPRPEFTERVPFIPDSEWDSHITEAEGLLHTTKVAFSESAIGARIRSILTETFDDLPEGYRPTILPVAGDRQSDGSMRWTGTDVVLGPLIDPESQLAQRFELRSETLARRLIVDGDRITGVVLEDALTGEQVIESADLVVVAADALRTPQLLWASGIRPKALGHYLTEHPTIFGIVALDPARIEAAGHLDELSAERDERRNRPGDPIVGANRVPFSEPKHPFSAQVMYMERAPIPIDPSHPLANSPWGYANVGWGGRKFPRFEDAVTFDDNELDYRGFPNMTITYELTERENEELWEARHQQARAASALGAVIPGGEARLMPNGSSLHYQGTFRIGAVDDGTSVCDPYSKVWGFKNLVLGGNGTIPTATAANPTLFSVAIAVRGAHRLIEEETSAASTDNEGDLAWH